MSIVQRHCERCGRRTPHTVHPFSVPTPAPISSQIDLTGRSVEPVTARRSLPDAQEFRCTVCGYMTTVLGPEQKTGGADMFEKLKRGEVVK